MNSENYEIANGVLSSIRWSMARLPKEGERVCGDYPLVKMAGKKLLLGAVDGLGHGLQAAEVSKQAIRILETFTDESIITLVKRCHDFLSGTRGAVMSLALIDTRGSTLTWTGVGNVDAQLLRLNPEHEMQNENIVLKGGVVGYKLPTLQASKLPISPGDMLIFTTDGVDQRFSDDIKVRYSTEKVVNYIATNYFKKSDDALILAVRYLEK